LSEITKADLAEFKADIKEHISDKLDPIVRDINGVKVTLYGKEGRNGLVGDVNAIKTSGKWMKAIAGTGFIGGVSKWVAELVGAGGGGAGTNNVDEEAGGGGGGEAITAKLTVAGNITVTVGNGGNGGIGNNNGANGGNSQFGDVVANGGSGGVNGLPGSSPAGGLGGTGGSNGTGNDIFTRRAGSPGASGALNVGGDGGSSGQGSSNENNGAGLRENGVAAIIYGGGGGGSNSQADFAATPFSLKPAPLFSLLLP